MDYPSLLEISQKHHAQLIAVSKNQPIEAIQRLYEQGQRDFGENKVQEILDKKPKLPSDIRWHMIGHLQNNKAKKIVGEVEMIQSVDRPKILNTINQLSAQKNIRTAILLQVHIAQEESKHGLYPAQTLELVEQISAGEFGHISLRGLMGMSTFTEDQAQVSREFEELHALYLKCKAENPDIDTLSMGMSGDYELALEAGSNMLRIGSLLFGARNYS